MLLSSVCFSSEIQYTTQHVQLKKQDLTGWQHDLMFKSSLTNKLAAGLVGTYIERFSLYEKSLGAFFAYHLNDKLSVEAKYVQGIGNLLLPERDSTLTAYYSLLPGYAPFLILRDSRYSDTKVDSATLGAEIEKFAHIIFIPQVMMGNAKFKSNKTSEKVYSYGVKVIYYTEEKFSAFIYGYKGLEASQGIIGSSNVLIRSSTVGIGGSYYFTPKFKTELSIDHTDYKVLNNQFVTATLNFSYKF